MIFLILVGMFFLGIVQVAWALVYGIFGPRRQTRVRFAYYGAGVAVYLLLLFTIIKLGEQDWDTLLFNLHFFGGAFALMCFHFWIVAMDMQLRSQEHALRFNGDGELPD